MKTETKLRKSSFFLAESGTYEFQILEAEVIDAIKYKKISDTEEQIRLKLQSVEPLPSDDEAVLPDHLDLTYWMRPVLTHGSKLTAFLPCVGIDPDDLNEDDSFDCNQLVGLKFMASITVQPPTQPDGLTRNVIVSVSKCKPKKNKV